MTRNGAPIDVLFCMLVVMRVFCIVMMALRVVSHMMTEIRGEGVDTVQHAGLLKSRVLLGRKCRSNDTLESKFLNCATQYCPMALSTLVIVMDW